MIRAVLTLLLLTGCAQRPAATACADHEGALPALVGQTQASARAAIAGMPGIRTIRAVGPGAMVTMDFRPDRVTLAMRDGKVEQARCG